MKKMFVLLLVGFLMVGCCARAETILSRENIPLAHTDAAALQRLHLLLGTPDGLELDRRVTRAEAVVMVTRMAGLIPSDTIVTETVFSDVSDHWAKHWIIHLHRLGYIDGVSETAFEPERTVTGEEFGKMLLSVMGYKVTELSQVASIGKEVGLLENNFTKSVVYNNDVLLRSDVARLCFASLTAKTASGHMLYKTLIEKGGYQERDFEGVLYCSTPAARKTTFADKINNTMMPQDANYMFSPLSIKMALGMATNGAQGETAAEILHALEIKDLQAFNANAKSLIEIYSKADIVKLSIANSIWINRTRMLSSFLDSYREIIGSYYKGESFEVNDADAVQQINSWVRDKTNGKIAKVIDNPDFATFLANAVYFKGTWQQPFPPNATQKKIFTSRDGKQTEMDFMSQTGYFSYFENESLQIIELPYSNREEHFSESGGFEGVTNHEDLSVSMFLFLPKEGRVVDVENLLNTKQMTTAYVSIQLPKFETEFSTSLNDVLKALGVRKAFDKEEAEFFRICTGESLWLTDSIHKTYIKLDEMGTEATAVTGFAGGSTSMPPQPKKFTADHPFTYVVRDNLSKEILFMGEYAFAEDGSK